jgi:hypothetical protein
VVVRLPAAVRGPGLADAPEEVFRSSTGLGDHCRGVAGEVSLEDLEHAAWMLECGISLQFNVLERGAPPARGQQRGLLVIANAPVGGSASAPFGRLPPPLRSAPHIARS